MPRVLITVPDGTPQPYRFELSRRLVTLGRAPDNDIVIDSGSVSLKHAEMVRVGDDYELRDLGSTNGIKFEGERRMSIPLEPGTSALIGDVAFDFQLTEEEITELTGITKSDVVVVEKPIVIRTGGGSGWVVLAGLLLAAVALLIGFSMSHEKKTGKSLMDEWSKKPAPKATAKPAVETTTPAMPAAETTPATPVPEVTPPPAPETTPAPAPEVTPTPEPEATPVPEAAPETTPAPEAEAAPEAAPTPEPEAVPANPE